LHQRGIDRTDQVERSSDAEQDGHDDGGNDDRVEHGEFLVQFLALADVAIAHQLLQCSECLGRLVVRRVDLLAEHQVGVIPLTRLNRAHGIADHVDAQIVAGRHPCSKTLARFGEAQTRLQLLLLLAHLFAVLGDEIAVERQRMVMQPCMLVFRIVLQRLQDVAAVGFHAHFQVGHADLLVGRGECEVFEEVDGALRGVVAESADGNDGEDEQADDGGDHVLDAEIFHVGCEVGANDVAEGVDYPRTLARFRTRTFAFRLTIFTVVVWARGSVGSLETPLRDAATGQTGAS